MSLHLFASINTCEFRKYGHSIQKMFVSKLPAMGTFCEPDKALINGEMSPVSPSIYENEIG